MERKLTCIVCPLGCNLVIHLEGNVITDITGNNCNRGKMYAETECTNPQRTITSTISCTDGSVVSVKTDRPIPKDKIFECMEIINQTVAELPITIGDILIDNVFGSKVVATQNRP